MPIPGERWEVVGIDFITHLLECQGYTALMMVVDHLSKELYAIPCTDEIDSKGSAKLA
jgi:hypothetical protein